MTERKVFGLASVVAVVGLLLSTESASAQSNGFPTTASRSVGNAPSPFGNSQGGAISGTVTAPGTATGNSMDGSNGGFDGENAGFGGLGNWGSLLSTDQHYQLLIESLALVEVLLQSGEVQVSSEMEILFLLLMVFEIKKMAAVQELLAGVIDFSDGSTNAMGSGAIPTISPPTGQGSNGSSTGSPSTGGITRTNGFPRPANGG